MVIYRNPLCGQKHYANVKRKSNLLHTMKHFSSLIVFEGAFGKVIIYMGELRPFKTNISTSQSVFACSFLKTQTTPAYRMY